MCKYFCVSKRYQKTKQLYITKFEYLKTYNSRHTQVFKKLVEYQTAYTFYNDEGTYFFLKKKFKKYLIVFTISKTIINLKTRYKNINLILQKATFFGYYSHIPTVT